MEQVAPVNFELMQSNESFYMLSFLLDNLDARSVHCLIQTLYPKHRSFRVVISQWLTAGHFAAQYYISESGLQWTSQGQTDYDDALMYKGKEKEPEGVEESKSAKRKIDEC